MDDVDLSRLTAIVTTSDDPKPLARLLKSLRKFCPALPVAVAGSGEPRLPKGVTHVKVPADANLSSARNALLARLRTPYFVLLSDELQLSQESNLASLLRPVASGELDVAAGELIRCRKGWIFTDRRPDPSHGTFELSHSELLLRPGHREANDRWHMCDVVQNFFVARADKIRSLGGWDDGLLAYEREEFFLRAFRQGLRVGLCPEVTAMRWPAPATGNFAHYAPHAAERMGLARMTLLDGSVVTASASLARAA